MLALAVALSLAAGPVEGVPAAALQPNDLRPADAVVPIVNGAVTVGALLATTLLVGDSIGRTGASFGMGLAGLGVGALVDVALFSPVGLVDVNRYLHPVVLAIPIAIGGPLGIGLAESVGGHGFGRTSALAASAGAVLVGLGVALLENRLVDLVGTIPMAVTAVLLTGALTTFTYAAVKGP